MPKLVVDFTDLVEWFQLNNHVTGIQRVVRNVFAHREVFDRDDIVFAYRLRGDLSFRVLDKTLVYNLTNEERLLFSCRAFVQLGAHAPAKPNVFQLVRAAFKKPKKIIPWIKGKIGTKFQIQNRISNLSAQPSVPLSSTGLKYITIDSEDTILVSGAFWLFHDTHYVIKKIKEDAGCKVITILYDLIPITHAHFIDQGFSQMFKQQVDAMLPINDKLLSISHHVKNECIAYLKENDLPVVDIDVMPFGFGTEMDVSTTDDDEMRLKKWGLDGEAFALCVGTVEPRKNPGLLLKVWQMLDKKHGQKTPKLVFAGRKSVGVNWVFKEVRSHKGLKRSVKFLNSVGDSDLASLYRKSKIVIFPSLVEGWGLPVEEAISYGKHTLASNATSIPEAGRDAPFYFDPMDPNPLFEEVDKCFSDQDYIREREKRVRVLGSVYAKEYTWENSANQVLEMVGYGEQST